MVDATWNGTNGSYNDPANWTPQIVPATPGDLGIVTSGTLSITRLNLTGVATQISSANAASPVTLNLHHATLGQLIVTDFLGSFTPIASVTSSGHSAANFIDLGGGIEGLNFGSTLNLAISGGSFTNLGSIDEQTFSNFTVTGSGKFANNGSIDITGANATFDTSVVGAGVISENIGIDLHGSLLEFADKVSAGQTIDLHGTQMILDDAKHFSGLINFAEPPPPPGIGLEQVELRGIAATSSTYAGGILDVLVGNSVAASLRINATDPQVSSTGGNTFITTT